MREPAVYMLASRKHGTLYVGVTSNLIQRVWQHREGFVDSFSKKHGCKSLVWFEQHETMESAIHREKRLKKYKRDQKIRLIETGNSAWKDLYETILP